MRYLGLDLGRKRIGVAVSDGMGWTARPVGVINVKDPHAVHRQVLDELNRQEAEAVVIGLPLMMNGQEGIEAERARRFGQELGILTSAPIHYFDERLTSVEAERILIERGVKKNEKRKASIDALAATIILQTFLDAQRNRPPDP